jgi:hypothetical protein
MPELLTLILIINLEAKGPDLSRQRLCKKNIK